MPTNLLENSSSKQSKDSHQSSTPNTGSNIQMHRFSTASGRSGRSNRTANTARTASSGRQNALGGNVQTMLRANTAASDRANRFTKHLRRLATRRVSLSQSAPSNWRRQPVDSAECASDDDVLRLDAIETTHSSITSTLPLFEVSITRTLPKGWTRHIDEKTGMPFYTQGDQTRWDKPTTSSLEVYDLPEEAYTEVEKEIMTMERRSVS